MIEKTVLDCLKANDLTAYMEVPETFPTGDFCVVEKTGSSYNNKIFSATIAIQSYSDSLYGASQLNEVVKGIMLYNLLEEDEIGSVDLNSDYNYTDSETKRYRYQAVYDITHY